MRLSILILLLAALLAGCAASPGADEPAPPAPPQLINETYFTADADADPLAYKKTAKADLDGDGQEETIVVATTAQWIEEYGDFDWDDGHPWYVYVDEADGTRTTVFADWVQLGELRVQIGLEPTSVIITREQGAGTSIYRVVYSGPHQTEATELTSFETNGYATFPPGSLFAR